MVLFQNFKWDIDLTYYYFKIFNIMSLSLWEKKKKKHPFSQTYNAILSNSLDHFTCEAHNYYTLVMKFHRVVNS